MWTVGLLAAAVASAVVGLAPNAAVTAAASADTTIPCASSTLADATVPCSTTTTGSTAPPTTRATTTTGAPTTTTTAAQPTTTPPPETTTTADSGSGVLPIAPADTTTAVPNETAPPPGGPTAPGGTVRPQGPPGQQGAHCAQGTGGRPSDPSFNPVEVQPPPPLDPSEIAAILGAAPLGSGAGGMGARSTAALLAILRPLALPLPILARVFAPFPVVGLASYGGAPPPPGVSPAPTARPTTTPGSKPTPGPKPAPTSTSATVPLSAGADIVAAQGTPVIASITGAVHVDRGAASGTSTVAMTGADGTAYVEANLAELAPGIVDGLRVAEGDVIGAVGGGGGLPHLHFEIHPHGGAGVDPLPDLDQWLAHAERVAASLAARSRGRGGPQPFTGTPAPSHLPAAASPIASASAASILPGVVLIGLTVLWFLRRRHRQRMRSESDLPLD
ncbi:MAG: peptidoglycan DD-metalloendopeptidase family protein [Acidimicrobiales bacterium]